jgi:hypothetical protein
MHLPVRRDVAIRAVWSLLKEELRQNSPKPPHLVKPGVQEKGVMQPVGIWQRPSGQVLTSDMSKLVKGAMLAGIAGL